MNYPHISVIIPSYDMSEYDYLVKSINSVLEQKYEGKFDIIVITEGDELTNNIKDKYGTSNNILIHKLYNPDGGLSVARNKGIELAQGDVVAYIDSDAMASENWLQNIG